jgi:hypothetical protein
MFLPQISHPSKWHLHLSTCSGQKSGVILASLFQNLHWICPQIPLILLLKWICNTNASYKYVLPIYSKNTHSYFLVIFSHYNRQRKTGHFCKCKSSFKNPPMTSVSLRIKACVFSMASNHPKPALIMCHSVPVITSPNILPLPLHSSHTTDVSIPSWTGILSP